MHDGRHVYTIPLGLACPSIRCQACACHTCAHVSDNIDISTAGIGKAHCPPSTTPVANRRLKCAFNGTPCNTRAHLCSRPLRRVCKLRALFCVVVYVCRPIGANCRATRPITVICSALAGELMIRFHFVTLLCLAKYCLPRTAFPSCVLRENFKIGSPCEIGGRYYQIHAASVNMICPTEHSLGFRGTHPHAAVQRAGLLRTRLRDSVNANTRWQQPRVLSPV